ncbi:MAG: aminotransferase class I/II-fold pyridoxal phosphate-dependent enzyme [Cyanobacteria bacterium P01_E01_bin.42]
MKLEPSLLELWLEKYDRAPYNLSSSGVTCFSFDELVKLTKCEDELQHLSLTYNATYGSLGLREAIASVYDNVSPEDILVTIGTTEAAFLYFNVRYEVGANVVVPVPAFPLLHEAPQYLGYEVRYLPLRKEEDFCLNLTELAKLVDDKTTTIVLNNPHNPTGIVYSEAELQGAIALAEKYNIDILADEHYRFLPLDRESGFIPSLFSQSPRILALGSIGKCFGCVGLRMGWLVSPRETLKACHDLKERTTYTVCAIDDLLVKSALLNWQKILPKYQNWIVENANYLKAIVLRNSTTIDWIEPQAGTFACVFWKNEIISSLDFARKLVEETGIFILPGETLNLPGSFRIALGIEPTIFQKAMNKFEEFLQRDR